MSNEEKIEYTVSKLKELWLKCPILRLGQLLSNLSVENGYVYGDLYVEDNVLLRIIEGKLKDIEIDKEGTLTKMKNKYI